MRTIFITAFNPFILRNLLATDALAVLKQQPDIRVVALVPDYKADFFRKEIGAPNVIIEGVALPSGSRQDAAFRFLGSSLADTETLALHQREQFNRKPRRFRFAVSWVLRNVAGRIPFFKQLVRRLDYLTINKRFFEKNFAQYRPDLVFASDLFNDGDVHLLAEARARGIRTAGMVRSWDNFTTKGMPRLRPDRVIVQNEIMKQEAIRYGAIPLASLFVSGMPQYDRFFVARSGGLTREAFFKKIGLDPAKKLILFSPLGKRFSDTDWQVMEILKTAIQSEALPAAQLLIRFTPNDEVPLGGFVPDEHCYIDCPGRPFHPGIVRDQELTGEDMDWLGDCLRYSNAIVAGGASIAVDGAIFGKPTSVIHFDGFEKKPYINSVRRFRELTHPKAMIESGAIVSAQSAEELIRSMREFLDNPDRNKTARDRMLAEQCGKLDGKSGARIGKFLVDQLG